jgi:hypothetical protein
MSERCRSRSIYVNARLAWFACAATAGGRCIGRSARRALRAAGSGSPAHARRSPGAVARDTTQAWGRYEPAACGLCGGWRQTLYVCAEGRHRRGAEERRIGRQRRGAGWRPESAARDRVLGTGSGRQDRALRRASPTGIRPGERHRLACAQREPVSPAVGQGWPERKRLAQVGRSIVVRRSLLRRGRRALAAEAVAVRVPPSAHGVTSGVDETWNGLPSRGARSRSPGPTWSSDRRRPSRVKWRCAFQPPKPRAVRGS